MFNVRLAAGHLYGKQLFTWLSLVVSLMAPFVLSFFPLDVLDEICDLIKSVSEGFLTYSFIQENSEDNGTLLDDCFTFLASSFILCNLILSSVRYCLKQTDPCVLIYQKLQLEITR